MRDISKDLEAVADDYAAATRHAALPSEVVVFTHLRNFCLVLAKKLRANEPQAEAPAAPEETRTVLTTRCDHCASTQVQATAWYYPNTGKLSDDEPPNDDGWCEECEKNVSLTARDERSTQYGFSLWREGEYVGRFETHEAAVREANESDRPWSITVVLWSIKTKRKSKGVRRDT